MTNRTNRERIGRLLGRLVNTHRETDRGSCVAQRGCDWVRLRLTANFDRHGDGFAHRADAKLAGIVVTPTIGDVICGQGAVVIVACAHFRERERGRDRPWLCELGAGPFPTAYRPTEIESARVVSRAAELRKAESCQWLWHPEVEAIVVVAPPAVHVTIWCQAARMVVACAERGERQVANDRLQRVPGLYGVAGTELAVIVAAPTVRRPIHRDGASVLKSDADRRKRQSAAHEYGRTGSVTSPPAIHVVGRGQAASLYPAFPDRKESQQTSNRYGGQVAGPIDASGRRCPHVQTPTVRAPAVGEATCIAHL